MPDSPDLPPHLAPLMRYAALLRTRHGEVPDVDPGTVARTPGC